MDIKKIRTLEQFDEVINIWYNRGCKLSNLYRRTGNPKAFNLALLYGIRISRIMSVRMTLTSVGRPFEKGGIFTEQNDIANDYTVPERIIKIHHPKPNSSGLSE